MRYHVGKRTALDGRVWWVCYYTNNRCELDSIGKFTTKRGAIYFMNHYLANA